MSREQTNYYEILEIAPNATLGDVHKAYERARQTYSQDNPALYSMFSPEEAKELLRLIDEAYSVLGNQTTRENYDKSRAAKGGPPPVHGNVHSPRPASPVKTSPAIDDASPNDFAVKTKAAPKAPLPEGMGRTILGTYKIDPTFEAELANVEDYDGGLLQRIRLYKNINLEKMSDATRISRAYLMAVETNDYKNLPAAVFVRGFIVQLARILALDESKVAASYMKLFKAGGGK